MGLGAGTYRVTLTSFDDVHPEGDDQTGERWFIQLLDSQGNVIDASGSISDLPSELTTLTESVGTVTVPKGVTVASVRAVMPAADGTNSVYAARACLAPA